MEKGEAERWEKIERLFTAARLMEPLERDEFLRKECEGDDNLRREVEGLIARSEDSTEPFDKPAIEQMAEQIAAKTLFKSGARLGHYEIIGHLGGGGMGRVYSARDLNLNHVVAIKVLLPDRGNWSGMREQFLQEARAMISLNHPNICRFFEFDFDADVNYIVMEYIEGETLRTRLARPIGIEEFTRIAEQCLHALIQAHQKNILHRDIKPENIMLSSEGYVKLCDFGLSKWLRNTEMTPNPGRNSGVKGTLGYIPPEIWLEREPDIRSDIYSLGVVFYEILTGQKTFQNLNGYITNEGPNRLPARKWNPRIPRRLEKVVTKMLQPSASGRHSSAEDVLADLRRASPRWGRYVRVAAALLTLSVAASSADHFYELTNVAVLPCSVVNASTADRNFCNGLMEMATRRIIASAVGSGVEISDPSDVRDRRVVTPEQALDRLGAEMVIIPRVQTKPETLQLTIDLVRRSNPRPLDSEDFAVDIGNVSGLERAISRSVGRMLGIGLETSISVMSTPSPEATRLFLEGVSLLQQYDNIDNVDKAISSFYSAVNLSQGLSNAHARLGEAYLRKYEFSKGTEYLELARQQCNKSLDLNHNLAAGRLCLAMLHNATGEPYKAIDELNAALNAEPNELIYRELAKAKEHIGDSWGAEKALKDAVFVRPEYWAPYASLGKFYTEHANYMEAERAYGEAIRRSRNNIQVRFSLSEVYAKQGLYEDAIRVLRESIHLRPTAQAYSNLGNTFLRLHRFAEAATELELARAENPRGFTHIGNLARAYYFLPDKREQSFSYYAEASALAQQQLEKVNPRDPNLHIMLAWYKAMLGKTSESYQHLDQAMSGQAPPEFFWIAAIVYNQFGDRERALSSLEKAVSEGFSRFEIQSSMEFYNLVDDPRFRAVIAQN